MYMGDYPEDATIYIYFGTYDGSGANVTISGTLAVGDVVIYKNGSDVQKLTTNGITVDEDFDTITGIHEIEIDTSNDTGDAGWWVAGAEYTAVIGPITVDSQTVYFVRQWSCQNRTGFISETTIAEMAQQAPPATPKPYEAVMYQYMGLRNANTATATERAIKNDAGTVICKATMSDNGTTFDQGELVTGP